MYCCTTLRHPDTPAPDVAGLHALPYGAGGSIQYYHTRPYHRTTLYHTLTPHSPDPTPSPQTWRRCTPCCSVTRSATGHLRGATSPSLSPLSLRRHTGTYYYYTTYILLRLLYLHYTYYYNKTYILMLLLFLHYTTIVLLPYCYPHGSTSRLPSTPSLQRLTGTRIIFINRSYYYHD